MIELPILHGYNTIQVYKQIGGSHPAGTAIFTVVTNTLVDPQTYQKFHDIRWVQLKTKIAVYIIRNVKINGKYCKIQLAREILGLPFVTGYRAEVPDHKNHDTRDNRLENLRVADRLGNTTNAKKYGTASKFRGVNVWYNSKGWRYKTIVTVFGSVFQSFTMDVETEAAFLYNRLHKISAGDFANLNVIPEGEVPSLERQRELIEAVNRKLKRDGFSVEV